MRHLETRDWMGRRRAPSWRRRDGLAWATAAVIVLASAAVAVIWQHVRYQGALVRYERALRRNEELASDVNAQRLKLQRQATMARLLPRSVELGLIASAGDDMVLVDIAPGGEGAPGLLDQIVPEAQAGDRSAAGRGTAARREGNGPR